MAGRPKRACIKDNDYSIGSSLKMPCLVSPVSPFTSRMQSCSLFSPQTSTTPTCVSPMAPTKMSPCPLLGQVEKELIKNRDLAPGYNLKLFVVGRISLISEVRAWSNGRGHFLTFNLLDNSCDISVVVFNSTIDEVGPVLKVNSVVEVSGFRVKTIDPNFIRIDGQKLEMLLQQFGTVNLSSDIILKIPFDFKDISQIHTAVNGASTDFLGIVYKEHGLTEGLSKNQKPYSCRTLSVTDKTKAVFVFKVWGEPAKQFELKDVVMIALRNAKIQEYEGVRSLNVTGKTLFWVTPNTEEASKLMDCFASERKQ